jgi:hypothetical protein
VGFGEKLVSELRQRLLNETGTCECLNFDGGFHSAHKMLVMKGIERWLLIRGK